MIAAAAVAGAIVYWRAGANQRSRRSADEMDEAITEGREAGAAALARHDTEQPTV